MAQAEGEPSDAELVAAAVRDPEAFGVFYDRHVVAVLRYLHRRTDSVETAADLCAETFAAAFGQRSRFRDTGTSARPWLFAIARNQLGHYLRRRKVSDRYRRRLGIEPFALAPHELERVEELVDAEPFRAGIRAALGAAAPRRWPTRSCSASARTSPTPTSRRRLGCSEGAARVRVSRGLNRLADLLEAR